MKEMLAELRSWQDEGEEIALATLVRVRGSAPRRPGARLGVTRGGRVLGSVSGGCVENDVVETAWRVLDSGRPEVASYGIGDELGHAAGLSCGGRIEVLIEPFREDESWRVLGAALEARRPVVLCVGLAPAALRGRRLVVDGEQTAGSIDAELDAAIVARARALSGEDAARVVELPGRGGEVAIFFEAVLPAPRLFIVGATHTAIPLCRMAKELGFRVAVIDPRRAWASAERFPEADEVILDWPGPALEGAGLDDSCFVLTLTHDPKIDLPALAQALGSPARYVGAMGSRRTHEGRKKQLREQGFGDEELARIRGPVGLDLGSRSPEEAALAILAEMVAVRNRTDARPLCEGRGPIRAS
jgi:xanthine dehydrogenase accessory factor